MATLDEIIDEQNTIHEELERMAADDSTTEEADGGIRDTLVKKWKDLRDYTMLAGSDLIARASSLIELHDKRHWLPGRGEQATRVAQAPGIARHMLQFGGDEYYDAFKDYANDPRGPGLQRAAGALSLSSAQGGYLLPYFLDQLQVA